ncbi:MAG TPA: hypothetical protein VGW80_09930 [Solirubrobacterales bacterium]|jgi:hypothetical protein|nr:hypothetical protein [Solirubrobacterales bacterium]
MKQLQRFTLVVLAMALAVLASASAASATTLEVKGVKKTEAVALKFTLKSGTSTIMKDTGGAFVNTCAASTIEAKSSVFTSTAVSAPVSNLSFGFCTEEPIVVDAPGSLTFENIAGTTNGTVRSIGAKWTTPSPFGSLTCTTAATPGTDIGKLTGVASGAATMDLNAVLNCGFFLPSAKWEGTYTVTSPEGLGATA